MKTEFEKRKQFMELFETMANEKEDDPPSFTPGSCECGSIACAYADEEAGHMFLGFMLAVEFFAKVGAVIDFTPSKEGLQ